MHLSQRNPHRNGLAAAALCVALFSTGEASAQEKERFRYDVRWGDSRVATMRLDVGCPRSDHIPAALVASSTGVADQIHSFEVRLDSFHDANRSLEGRTRIVEEGEPRSFKSRFKTTSDLRVTRTFRGKTTEKAFKLPGSSHDLLSWMLDLRRKNLEPGKAYRYFVWDGWKLFMVEASVGRPEAVATGKGIKRASRIELHRTILHHGGPRAFQPREDREELGTLWIGVDPERTPWAMTFDAPIGRARIELASMTRRTCSER